MSAEDETLALALATTAHRRMCIEQATSKSNAGWHARKKRYQQHESDAARDKLLPHAREAIKRKLPREQAISWILLAATLGGGS